MNALRRYLTAVLVGLATVAATSAQERVDTVAEAFAAMWSHYLTPLTSPGMASDSERLRNYTDGFRKGLRDSINETYVQGYYEGVQLAARLRTLHGLGLDVDARNLTTALARIFAGGKPMMAPLDAEAYITSLIDVEVRPQGPSAEEQQAFLDEVASRSGVERTPSGLLFEIVQPGTGESQLLYQCRSIVVSPAGYNIDYSVLFIVDDTIGFVNSPAPQATEVFL